MLYFCRGDVSESINVKKTSILKECIICHYWYFLDKEIKFELSMVFKMVAMVAMNVRMYQ